VPSHSPDTHAGYLPEAREILQDATRREVNLSIGASVHDPTDPVGRLLFNVLATVAQFEVDSIRLRGSRGWATCRQSG
jgi:DNA invertase Pin-like site-specific DNA recombinase